MRVRPRPCLSISSGCLLADQALMTEVDLEELPQDDPRCDPIERVERIWRKACERTARRVDALEAALQAHNDAEVMPCG
ncbi:MAG: hypothetical protein IPJ94_09465 [Chloroflexi bacterium]|nr:hypothetical protein [Chloroflexota bacterium]